MGRRGPQSAAAAEISVIRGGRQAAVLATPPHLDETASEVFDLTAEALADELRHEHLPLLSLYAEHMAEAIRLGQELRSADDFETREAIRKARARESAEAARWATKLRITPQASTRVEAVAAKRNRG